MQEKGNIIAAANIEPKKHAYGYGYANRNRTQESPKHQYTDMGEDTEK